MYKIHLLSLKIFLPFVRQIMSIKSNPNSICLKSIKVDSFGNIGSKDVLLFTLHNSNGISVKITNYGGIITSLIVPDNSGKKDNIVLGYDNLDDYLKNDFYYGAIIGRFCNRIANGKFSLDNKHYKLVVNNGINHLHGGTKGFDKVIWNAKPIEGDEFVGVEMSYLSRDREEGYPGNLDIRVSYKLTNNNDLKIEYFATTDKKTIVNLTQHSYFNLSGNLKSEITNHYLKINADRFLPTNENLIPIGSINSVKNTPFDFNEFKKIETHIHTDNKQLKFANGYDHTWAVKAYDGKLKKIAEAYEKESGRILEVYTTKPGVQFYSGNFLNANETDVNGNLVYKRNGFCLETQYFPDSPNQPNFPSTILLPEEQYKETTVFKFLIKS